MENLDSGSELKPQLQKAVKFTNGKLINETTSLCSQCKIGVPAKIVEHEGRIIMEKQCPEHGGQTVLISSDVQWYYDTLNYPAVLKTPKHFKNTVQNGCPFDCGACPSHEQSVYLPVVPITSACNLDCPICYTINKNENAYYMSLTEFEKTLNVIRDNDPDLKIINFTGGEPTLHPQLVEIIKLCHDAGMHRITLSTHGLTFLKNEALLEQLAELDTRMVLSFDSFNDDVNDKMLGARVSKAKLKVLDLFDKYDIDTTLIPVIAEGYNNHELGDLINLALERDCIRSLELHTMTFTGQGGEGFDLEGRVTTPDVLKAIEKFTGGQIVVSDFVPSPCAHPLCYQTCYLLETEQGVVPFTRFMSKAQIRELLRDNLYIEPGERMETIFTDVINELWSSDLDEVSSNLVMQTLKKNLKNLYSSSSHSYKERQKKSERSAKTIYLHAHMDEHNFDSDRIRQCCVGVPSADGGNIPTCAYNIHYRGRDDRFSSRSIVPLQELGGGRKFNAF